MSKRIFRYEVPVDDQWHELELYGDPLAVACSDPRVVEFWAVNAGPAMLRPRAFMVVGTGHELPEVRYRHWGTVVFEPDFMGAKAGRLVWHLLEHVR